MSRSSCRCAAHASCPLSLSLLPAIAAATAAACHWPLLAAACSCLPKPARVDTMTNNINGNLSEASLTCGDN